jgi:hypothetical protein
MIPDEAVEAAARALWRTNQHDDEWVGEFPEYIDFLRSEARYVLEAAAPHLQSAAWVRGVEDGYHHRPNPYKEQA